MGLFFLIGSGEVWGQCTETVTLTGTGNGSWSVPAGVTSITVEVWGAGGAGGRATGNPAAGGGGSGGGYVRRTFNGVSGNFSYFLGAGGNGGSGTNGQSSWFQNNFTLLAVGGNGGGIISNNNSWGNGATALTSGNIGGTLASFYGGRGGNAGNNFSGGGGASAGTSGNGSAASGINGGTSSNGSTAGPDGRNNSGNGANGNTPGSGGAGGRAGGSTQRNGGNGGNGQIRITYTYEYCAEFISTDYGPSTWCAGEDRNISVTIRNGGTATWTNGNGGTRDINIGVRWNPNGGNWTDFHVRTDANGLAPGDTRTYNFTLRASNNPGGGYTTPLSIGNNNIRFDVVNEQQFWFRNRPGNAEYISPNITITGPPATLNYANNNPTYCANQAISANNPTVTGGSATSYTVSPALPAGLTLNPSTGQISGTPTIVAGVPAANYTVTATNSCGSTTRVLNITINPAAPSGLNYTNNTVTYCAGSPITTNVPSIGGGGPATIFSVSPALPAGLSLNTSNGQITGTPTTLTGVAAANYTVTASNSCGNTTRQVNITIRQVAEINDLSDFICSGVPFTITPLDGVNGSIPTGTSYTWTAPTVSGGVTGGVADSGSSITGILFNPTNAAQNVTYTVTPITNGCPGDPFQVNILLNPSGNINTINRAVCSDGSFSVTPVHITNGVVPANTTYTWTAPAVTGGVTGGLAGSGASISGTLKNPTNVAQTAIYAVTPITGSCIGQNFNVVVTVNPRPAITAMNAASCSNQPFSVTPANGTNGLVPSGTNYTWTAPSLPAGLSGGSSGTGTNITGTLTNSTNAPLNAIYTVTPTSGTCVGNTFTITVKVNPSPVIPTQTPTICSGDTFTVNPTNGGATIVPTGTTYTWTVVDNPNVTGETAQAASQATISQILVNTSPITQTVTYTVTPISGAVGNCAGNPFAVTVTVNPRPILNSLVTQTRCSNISTSYTATSATPGITFSWTRALVSGISNPAESGTGATTTETLVNTTPNPLDVVYVFTLTANGCSNTQNIIVTVNPSPELSSTLTPTDICSNGLFSYNPISSSTGASFTWTRAAVSGISNAAITAPQTSDPNEILVNTTAQPIDVVYSYTITANGCSNTQDVTVTVNPTPELDSSQTPDAICSNTAFTYSPTSLTPGASFSWTRASVSGISNAAVTTAQPTNPNEVLVNTTPNPIDVIYAFTISANGCTNTQNVVVTVTPTPILSSTLTPPAICSGSPFSYNPTSVVSGANFTWTRTAVTGISNAAVTTPQSTNPDETLINTTANPIDVVYTYTISANGCSNSQDVMVTVNPTPILDSPLTPAAICGKENFTYTPSSATSSAVFTWTRAAVSGISNAAVNAPQTNDPNEILVNTTQDPIDVIYTYTITANGCTNTQDVSVTVHPTPNISAIPTSVCSDGGFTVNPVHGTDGVVPTGTTYTWTVVDNPNITGESNQNTPQSTISQILTNTSTNPQDVIYTVTPISGTCTGNTFTVTVTVNGEVSIDTQPSDGSPEVCFGDTFPSISVVASGATGITYQWYSNTSSSNSGGTAIPGATSATFTPPSDAEGESYYYVEVIGPCNTVVSSPTGRYFVTPTVITVETPINAASQTICPGDDFTPLFFEAIGANLEYKWFSNTTATTTGGTEISGTDNPSFTPPNTEFGPVYYYALASSDCGTLTSAVAGPFAITGSSSTTSDQTLCVDTPLDPVITHVTTGTTGISNDGIAGANGLPSGISASWNAGVITISGTPTSAVGSPFNYAIPLIGACGTEVATGTITVNPHAEINAISHSICTGGSFTVTPQDGTDGTIPVGTTYQWTVPVVTGGITGGAAGSGTEIVGILVNPTNSIHTATYTVTPKTGTCNGPSFTVTVTVNPTPSLSSTLSPTSICSNTAFTYTPTSAVAGAAFTWTRAVIAGISNSAGNGSGNINETLINTASSPIDVIYTYEISANGCTNTQEVTVRVKPTPTLSSELTPATICGNSTFSYTPTSDVSGAVFTWTRAAVTGISNPAITNPQISNPNETLINNTNGPIDVIYAFTITANGCSSTQNVTVTVDPRPTLNSTLTPAAICSGATFTYTPTSASPTATFSWTRAAVAGISNPAVTTPQSSNPAEVLQNTSANAIDVTYVFTISENGCTNTQNVRVTVNPTPQLSSTLTPSAICSGSTLNYSATTATSGTSISWTRPAVTGISNAAITSPQTTNPSENLVNTTDLPINVVYVYSLTANGCTNTQNVTVTVNPTPTLSSTLTPSAVCSDSEFTYFPTSVTPGTNFFWTRAAVAGISNGVGSGNGNINETLVNTTSSPINVVYALTTSANGCSITENVTVRIDPTPSITDQFPGNDNLDVNYDICSGESFSFAPLDVVNGIVPPGTTYSWTVTRENGNLSGASDGNGAFISGTISNSDTQRRNAFYLVTPSYNGCNGAPFIIRVRVQPEPNVAPISSPAAVCNGTPIGPFNFSGSSVSLPNGNPTTTEYNWTNDNPSIGLSASGTGDISSFTAINNGVVPVTANITVTPMANGCNGPSETFAITVNPTPKVTVVPDYCVVGGQVQLIANSNVAGSTFLWNTGQTTSSILVDLSGQYSVKVTAPNGCTTTESIGVAQELVVNGNFTDGNTGFTTGYLYQADNPSVTDELVPEGRYGVGTNAHNYHNNFWGNQDRTNNSPGPRNMMIINGYPGSNNTTIWQQTVTVEANTDYYFTASALSLNAVPPYARLRFEVNGVQVGTIANLTAGVNSNSNNGWQRFYSDPVWNSGSVSGPITIRIVNLEPAAGGNDFALDDISFGTLKPFITLTSYVGSDNQTVCQNSPMDPITYNAGSGIFGPEVTGLPAGITPVWNGVELQFIGSPTVAGVFTYTVRTTGTCVEASVTGTITVRQTPTSGVIATDQTICEGQDPTILTSTTDGTGDAGSTISYLWESNTDLTNSNWTLISGQTGASYDPPFLIATTQYRRITLATLGGLSCESPPTAPVTITVQNVPTPGSIAADHAVCIGGDPALFSSNAAGNGDGTITYRWESAVGDFTSWSSVSGANGATYDAPAGLTETTRFRRVTISTLNGVACESAPTAPVQVTVNAEPTAGEIATDQEICSGGNPAAFTSTADGTGAGAVYYIWESAVSPFTDWTEISGANLPTYDAPAGLTVDTQYRRRTVSTFNGVTCESVPTSPVTVTILIPLEVDPVNPNPPLCLDVPQPVTIIHKSTGATGITNEGIPGANGLPLGISAAFDSSTGDITISGKPTEVGTFNYSITVTGNCGTDVATGIITVDDPSYPISDIHVENPPAGSDPDYISTFTVFGPELTPGDYEINYSTSGANAVGVQTITVTVTTPGQFTFQSLPYLNEGTTILTINSIQGITDQCPFSVPSNNTVPYGINCSTEYLEADGDATYSVGADVSEVTIQVFGDGGTNTAAIPVSAGQQIFLVFDGSDIFATQVPKTETKADRLAQAIVSTTGSNGRFVLTYDCSPPPPCSGTGDIYQYTDSEGYTVIRVTGDCSSWTWTAPDGLDEFEVLIVGGGGGGGFGEAAGGGGGGAVIYKQFKDIKMNGLPGLQGAVFQVTPGGEGIGATNSNQQGGNGTESTFIGSNFTFSDSTFNDLHAVGGGGGGSSSTNSSDRVGANGASGGGGAAFGNNGSPGGVASEGNDGGIANGQSYGGSGAGGGGAASGGNNGGGNASLMSSGSGGDGMLETISGENVYYGAGGGGTSSGGTVNEPGMGGSQYSIGGSQYYAGGRGNNTGVGLPATTFGSGGGAGRTGGSDGFQGVVYIRYPNYRILPVEYLYFHANYNSIIRSGDLTWATAKEWENSRFEIERSLNNVKEWTKIDEVAGAGYSESEVSYDYSDKNLPAAGGHIFYRLKQFDFDGGYTYSDTRSIKVEPLSGTTYWKVFPNPTTGYPFYIEILDPSSYRDEPITLRIISATGLYETLPVLEMQEMVNQVSDWFTTKAAGIYTLEISWGDKREYHKVILRR